MELEIKGNTYSFVFGLGWLQTINKKFFVDKRAQEIGMNTGLDVLAMNFEKRDPQMLIDILKIANDTEKEKVSAENIYLYIKENGITDLYDEVIEELKKDEFLGESMKMAIDTMKANVEEASMKETD